MPLKLFYFLLCCQMFGFNPFVSCLSEQKKWEKQLVPIPLPLGHLGQAMLRSYCHTELSHLLDPEDENYSFRLCCLYGRDKEEKNYLIIIDHLPHDYSSQRYHTTSALRKHTSGPLSIEEVTLLPSFYSNVTHLSPKNIELKNASKFSKELPPIDFLIIPMNRFSDMHWNFKCLSFFYFVCLVGVFLASKQGWRYLQSYHRQSVIKPYYSTSLASSPI